MLTRQSVVPDHSVNTWPPPPSLTVVCGELGNSGEQVSPAQAGGGGGGQGSKLSPLPQARVTATTLRLETVAMVIQSTCGRRRRGTGLACRGQTPGCPPSSCRPQSPRPGSL